jgi:outer membrane lipoprotein-sorting protein
MRDKGRRIENVFPCAMTPSVQKEERIMKRILCIFFVLSAFVPSAVRAQQLDADQLLKKVDQMLTAFQDMSLHSTMTVNEKDGTKKVREIIVWQQGEKRMVKFVKPASEVGLALLATDSTTNYVYLPSYERVRRVAAHVRNQTFMGTDFSQEDMAITSYAKDFTPRLIGDTDTQWELELSRKPGASITYSKLVIKVSKQRFTNGQGDCVDRLEYYDNSGDKLKVEERGDFILCDGKYWKPQKITMTSVKDNHQTLLDNSDFKHDQKLPADFFSERNLKTPLR